STAFQQLIQPVVNDPSQQVDLGPVNGNDVALNATDLNILDATVVDLHAGSQPINTRDAATPHCCPGGLHVSIGNDLQTTPVSTDSSNSSEQSIGVEPIAQSMYDFLSRKLANAIQSAKSPLFEFQDKVNGLDGVLNYLLGTES